MFFAWINKSKGKGERRTVQLISLWPLAVNLIFMSADTVLRRIAALNPTCHGTGMKEWAFWAPFWCLMLSSETANFQHPYFLPVAQTLVERAFVGNKKTPNSLGPLAQVTLVWGHRSLKQEGWSLSGRSWEPPLQGCLQQHPQLDRVKLSRLLFCCMLISSWAVVLWVRFGKRMGCFYWLS